jgi:thiamine-phosphate pyrophosphorylase
MMLPQGIYGMTAEKLSSGRTNIEVVGQMLAAGIKLIQYREKRPAKSFRVMYEECLQLREMTRQAGALFIVNDYVELARLVDADGVHIGQDDLPAREVRRLIGKEKILGLSTHSPAQAQEAIESGVDYIGVGPIFATNTKEDVCAPVGFDYLDYVVKNIRLPFVAIGGIKRHNLAEVVRRGASTICLVSEVVEAPDVRSRVEEIAGIIAKNSR